MLDLAARYGRVVLTKDGDALVCACLDRPTAERKETWRSDREGELPHLRLFQARAWGVIIYDEVHLLPAPVFRITADLPDADLLIQVSGMFGARHEVEIV